MPRGKRKSTRPEILSTSIEIRDFRASIRTSACHRKGEEPYIDSQPWLELRGKAKEPWKGVDDVKISVYPEDDLRVGTVRPASIGSLQSAKPEMHFVWRWSQMEFDRVWAFALSGRLRWAHVAYTKPHYGSALIVSASFSTEEEE